VVTAAVPPLPSTAAPGLLRKLVAAVRPEFRVDILVPERTTPYVVTWLTAETGNKLAPA
jgi:hypothetical protein